MAIAGALIGGAIGAFGKKPVVPDLKPIDVNATQKQTVAGNAASFADIAKLATQVNTFNQDQLDALIDRALGPGVRQQIQGTITSQLRGEIPDDVQRAIQRGVAERTASGNAFGGGGFSRNITARDLGLTSLQLTQQGLSSAESWLSRATAPQFDVTSMFFTPQQRLAFEQQQQSAQFQRDVMAAGVEAAPDPATAALGQEIDRFFNTAASAGMMMAGGGMGGLAGGGGSAGNASQQAQWLNTNRMLNQDSINRTGSAGGQGLPGLGQSNLNGLSMWQNQFGGLGGLGGAGG
jgi:hypothetical protein